MKRSDQELLLEQDRRLRKLISLSALTWAPLHSDFDHAIDQFQRTRGSQFWSRTCIRCLCAVVEATLYGMRQMALEMADVSKVQLDKDELAILTEKREKIVNGVTITVPKFIPIQDALKESYRLFAKALNVNVSIQCDAGYEALCKTFLVRNRLMHPKGPMEVEVRLKDIDVANEGIRWFNSTGAKFLNDCRTVMGERITRLRAALK